jgi:uncharacterized protein (DUF924 family)
MDEAAEAIVRFWIDEVGPEGWYSVDPILDAEIRERFMDQWQRARSGSLEMWRCKPGSSLALLILLDQFPRNMFRDDPRSFASDPLALSTAKIAIAHHQDEEFEMPARQFFYMPFMHSELLSEQERCVRLLLLNVGRNDTFRHALAHREVIRRFGRFPHRNAVLGRTSTAEEIAFLEAGGSARIIEEVAA